MPKPPKMTRASSVGPFCTLPAAAPRGCAVSLSTISKLHRDVGPFRHAVDFGHADRHRVSATELQFRREPFFAGHPEHHAAEFQRRGFLQGRDDVVIDSARRRSPSWRQRVLGTSRARSGARRLPVIVPVPPAWRSTGTSPVPFSSTRPTLAAVSLIDGSPVSKNVTSFMSDAPWREISPTARNGTSVKVAVVVSISRGRHRFRSVAGAAAATAPIGRINALRSLAWSLAVHAPDCTRAGARRVWRCNKPTSRGGSSSPRRRRLR